MPRSRRRQQPLATRLYRHHISGSVCSAVSMSVQTVSTRISDQLLLQCDSVRDNSTGPVADLSLAHYQSRFRIQVVHKQVDIIVHRYAYSLLLFNCWCGSRCDHHRIIIVISIILLTLVVTNIIYNKVQHLICVYYQNKRCCYFIVRKKSYSVLFSLSHS